MRGLSDWCNAVPEIEPLRFRCANAESCNGAPRLAEAGGRNGECAAAVVGARLGLEMGALLFCSDNTTLPKDEDRVYGGLRNPDTRRGFEAGTAAVIEVLTAFSA